MSRRGQRHSQHSAPLTSVHNLWPKDRQTRFAAECRFRARISLPSFARCGMRTTLATLALVTAVLTACSEDHVCTLIGAEPGVGVTGGVNGASVRVCAGSTCATTATVNGHGFVNMPSLRPVERSNCG